MHRASNGVTYPITVGTGNYDVIGDGLSNVYLSSTADPGKVDIYTLYIFSDDLSIGLRKSIAPGQKTYGLHLHSDGILYYSDGNSQVGKLSPFGFPTRSPTVIPSAVPAVVPTPPPTRVFTTSTVNQLTSTLYGTRGVWYDNDGGYLYVAAIEARLIYSIEVASYNNISVYAGGGTSHENGAGALDSELGGVFGLWGNTNGALYFSEPNNCLVRRLCCGNDLSVYEFAGNGNQSWSGDGGLATEAALNYPRHLSGDTLSNVYIADSVNLVIRKVSYTDNIISTLSGLPEYVYYGVWVDTVGNVFASGYSNDVQAYAIVSWQASTQSCDYFFEDAGVQLLSLFGDSFGNLYAASRDDGVRLYSIDYVSTYKPLSLEYVDSLAEEYQVNAVTGGEAPLVLFTTSDDHVHEITSESSPTAMPTYPVEDEYTELFAGRATNEENPTPAAYDVPAVGATIRPRGLWGNDDGLYICDETFN